MLSEKEIEYFRGELKENNMIIISQEDLAQLLQSSFGFYRYNDILSDDEIEEEFQEYKTKKLKELTK